MKILFKQKKNRNKNEKGFVILFAVMISSMLLAIALGVANISLNEIKFGTSAKETNDAFFAADIGAECMLYNDKSSNSFEVNGYIKCFGEDEEGNPLFPIDFDDAQASILSFAISAFDPEGESCALVTIEKTANWTQIFSKGYNKGGGGEDNTCDPPSNSVERVLEVNSEVN